MRVYRAFQRKHEATAFSGEGARIYGGRWNSVGVAVVYSASTFSLAVLELMVNTSGARIPSDMLYAPVDIPDKLRLTVLDVSALSENWLESAAPADCQYAGDMWVSEGRTVGLVVPSAVARIDTNVLLNPAHSDFSRLVIGQSDLMAIDRRLIH